MSIFKYCVFFMLTGWFNWTLANPTEVTDETAMSDWINGFKQHLLQQKDPNLKAQAVFMLSEHSTAPEHLLDPRQAADRISEILTQPGLSQYGLHFLTNLCGLSFMQETCDSEAVLKLRLQRFGHDGSSHLMPLGRAMQAGVEGEVIDWIKQMADANEFNVVMHYSDEFELALLEYLKSSPFPEDYLEDDFELFSDMGKLSEADLVKVKKRLFDYQLVMFKINMELKMPFPSFKGLIDACGTYEEVADDCLKIGQLMVASGKESLVHVLGLATQIKVREKQGKSKEVARLEQHKAAKNKELQCLSQVANDQLFYLEDPDLYEQWILVSRSQGDMVGLRFHAEQKYQKALKNGAEDPEVFNPARCYDGESDTSER